MRRLFSRDRQCLRSGPCRITRGCTDCGDAVAGLTTVKRCR